MSVVETATKIIKRSLQSTDLDIGVGGMITRQFTPSIESIGPDANFQITVPATGGGLITPVWVTEKDKFQTPTRDWPNGNWTVRLRITARETSGHARVNTVLLTRIAPVYDVDGVTIVGYTGIAFNLLNPATSITTTGLYTFTMTQWNDNSQNADEIRTANDRLDLDIDFEGTTATPRTINIGCNLSNGNDEIDCPFGLLPFSHSYGKINTMFDNNSGPAVFG